MKKEIRKKVKEARMRLSQEDVEKKSVEIKKKLITMQFYKQAKTIMSYVDYRNEVLTGPIIMHALGEGKRVTVPVCEIHTRRLIPSEIKKYPDDLSCGAYGIREPRKDCMRPVDALELDLVLVPGVAFDVRGNRLGYGAGYYDRFLDRLKKDAVTIALAYDFQIHDNVYPEEHDVPVHFIITEKRIINRMDHRKS